MRGNIRTPRVRFEGFFSSCVKTRDETRRERIYRMFDFFRKLRELCVCYFSCVSLKMEESVVAWKFRVIWRYNSVDCSLFVNE